MSSILIKGMDMPKPKNGEKAFYPCMICAHPDGTVNITFNDEIGCIYPLFEVPTPHGDLIDRDLLLKEYEADPEDDQKMREESLKNYILMTKIVDIVTKNINETPVIIKAEE